MLNMKGSLVLWFVCVFFFFGCALGDTVTLEKISDRIKQRFDELDTFLQGSVVENFAYLYEKMEAMNKKQDEMNQRLNGIDEMDQKITSKFTDAELRDESLKEEISSMKEEMEQKFMDAELRDASLKEEISSMKEEAELRDESLKEELSCMKEEMQEGFLQVLRPVDCKEILNFGRNQSRVYTIYPVGMPGGVNVYCDQESDGGGWIVFVQRQQQTPQVDFVRPFADYANGFGEPGREFWLGNRILHAITGTSNYELRAEATNVEGETRQASWATFRVGSEDTQFTVTVTGYRSTSSTMGDGMSKEGSRFQSNQEKFSTYDKDDTSEGCSSLYGRVGWWFRADRFGVCGGSLPTGIPVIGESSSSHPLHHGLHWGYWEKNSSSPRYTFLSWVQMKIRAQ